MHACSVLSDSLQLMDWSPPDSSIHGIFQARILEWVAISFSRESSPPRDRTCVSCVYLHWQANSLPWVTWEASGINVSSFVLMKGNKCTTDFHSWGGRLLRGKLKPTWESLNSMPRIHNLVPNRDGILRAVPYHYSHSFTSLKIILGNKSPAVENRYNFPKVKQFAIKMFLSKGQSYCMTIEVFMVHSQLSRTMLLDIHMNSLFLCLPFDYFIAHAPSNCKPGRQNGRMWFY